MTDESMVCVADVFPFSLDKQTQLHESPIRDPELTKLIEIVKHGWLVIVQMLHQKSDLTGTFVWKCLFMMILCSEEAEL